MKPTNKEKLVWILILAIATLLIEYVVFGIVILSPNARMIMDNTDGRQIYFNIAYHVKYGHGFILSNQNYPYYESLFMTDAQATLAIILNFIQQHIFQIDTYTVGIVNGIILYTIPICAIFLFLIFKHLKIETILAFIFALLITFLSPQIVRITGGHYGLSYLFFIPMLIYFSFKMKEKKKGSLFFAIFSILSILFFGFNNGYLSLIGSMYFIVFGLFTLVVSRGIKNREMYFPILTGIVSIGLFFVIIKSLDSVIDRELLPYGFLSYYAQFESIFIPTTGKLHAFYEWIVPMKIAIPTDEGVAYVGLIGFLTLIFTSIRIIYFIFTKRFKRIVFPVLNSTINILFLTGIIVFLYAICFPFRFGMEFLIDDFPFIQQFRSTGRFAWIFYFTFSIYAVFLIHLLIRKMKFKNYIIAPFVVIICCMAAYSLDIQETNKFDFRYINTQQYFPNIFDNAHNCSDFAKQYHIDTNSYSSIYGIPVCNQWNAKYGREDEQYKLVTKLINLTYFTSLPMINSKLSRVSTSQTMITGQFVSHPIIRRELFSVMDTSKKILIVLQNDYSMSESEKYVLQHAEKLTSDSIYSYYSFSPNRQFYHYADSIQQAFDANYTSSIAMLEQAIKDNKIIEAYYPTNEKNNVAISDKNEDKVISESDFYMSGKDSTIDFSIWSKVDIHTDGSPWIKLDRYNANNELFDTQYMLLARALDYQHGMLKAELSYKMLFEKEHLKVSILKGKGHVFERLLIKPKSWNVYDVIANKKYFNSYIVE